MTCRVSMDELDQDYQQMTIDERIKAIKSTLRDIAQEQFVKDIRSLSRLDWLGFEDFSPLYADPSTILQNCRNSAYSEAINDVFVTAVLAENWKLAGVLVITAGGNLDEALEEAAENMNLEAASALIKERCEEEYLVILDRVTDNWSDCE